MKTSFPNLTLQQLLYTKKNPIFNYTLQQFINYNTHIGEHKKNRNNTNMNFIYNTPKNLDLINLQKSLHNLRLILTIITDLTSQNGQSLIILQTNKKGEQLFLKTLTKELRQKFICNWTPGYLSNFKEFRQQNKQLLTDITLFRIPNFIFFLAPYRKEELKTELIPFQIPAAVLQNTSSINLHFLYTLPLTINTIHTKIFINQLIINSILLGYNKKILFFTQNKIS